MMLVVYSTTIMMPECDILDDTESEYSGDDKVSSVVPEKLSGRVNKRFDKCLGGEKLKDLLLKHNRPENCQNMMIAQGNPEIWGKLNTSCDIRLMRRKQIKPALIRGYAAICSPHVPMMSNLFGDELCKQLKDVKETNKIGYTVASRTKTERDGQVNFLGRGRNNKKPFRYRQHQHWQSQYFLRKKSFRKDAEKK
ncbi:uncharacterized protein LOC135479289 [Liolophura sinensis]|uniref:uncharacterized protein LOC135479289 n=1 Tax=Liolophura sinensis TaxID=3198878 RepID=UPI0031593694